MNPSRPHGASARAREASHLASASLRTGAGTIASRLTGLLRLVAAAYALGGAPTGDAFNLANNTPNIVHDLVLGGVLGASFVPVFVDRLATRSRREAEESISAVVSLALVVLFGATVLLVAGAPYVIELYTLGSAPGLHPAAEHALAVDLLRYFAPQLFAYGAISLIGAVLATRDRFVAVGVVPVLNNLVGIAVLLGAHVAASGGALAHARLSSGVIALLGLGTTAGVVVQALALLPSLRRAGVRLRWRWAPHDPALATIRNLSGWTMGFVATNQLAVLIVQALEYRLNGVTIYAYAYQFFLFPYAVVAISVVNVATPSLARAFVANELGDFGRRFGVASRQVLALVLPAAVGYLMLARPAIGLVLVHGTFNAPTGRETAATLALFALGLPAFCLYFLAIRSFQAMQDTRTAFVCYALENGVNILLACLLYRPLGVRGLALAYSAAYTIGALAAVAILRERLGTIGGRRIVFSVGRSVVLSAVMAVVIALAAALVGTGTGFIGWLQLLVIVAAGAAAYLGGAGVAASMRGWKTSRRAHR